MCHILFGVMIMPSKTFLNLAVSKQEALLKAAHNEFTRALLDAASINRIIKDANISRGSFYMYFEDKEDIYFYLLEKNRIQFADETRKIFNSCDGDLIIGFSKLFDYLSSTCLAEENKLFFKNVLMNINFKNEYPIFAKHNPEKIEQGLNELIQIINKQSLNIKSDEDLIDILNMIMMLTIHNLVKIVKNPDLLDKNKKKYLNQLRILKQGIYIK